MAGYTSLDYAVRNRWDHSHLRKVDRLLALSPDARVLEVGCGRGHLTTRLAARGIDVIGVDANPMAVEIAGTERVRHMKGESLDFDEASFDVVISIHALEHIPDLELALSEMARVLVGGGRALHVYPAEPIRGLYAIPTSIILHGTPFKAREVHRHKLWPAKLAAMMAGVGLAETHNEFHFFRTPEFASVFEKVG